MIHSHMALRSEADAMVWVQNLGIDFTPGEALRLAAWIWQAKPHYGCRYAEHPVRHLDLGTIFELAFDSAPDLDFA
jgi:hypothetical protein